MSRALLMIPGPIEISPAVQAAFAVPPPGHLGAATIEAFGSALESMRAVWRADADAQPFVVAGSGTLAMEMAVVNLVEPGESVVVVNSGYFSDRMAEMLRRRGANVSQLVAEPGSAPPLDDVRRACAAAQPRALFATHVDTSSAARVDAKGLAELARECGALSVFDGVCATAAERFEMAEWGADVYLSASQKAVGLPPGLALLVVTPAALEKRRGLATAPPLGLDFEAWLPVMRAYEERRPSYFATPATNLVMALAVSLRELEIEGMPSVYARHERAARAMRAAFAALELELLPRAELSANTLSAVYYPAGASAELLRGVARHGVVVAGGLHPALKDEYFRVGHMGYTTTRPDWLLKTVEAIAAALNDLGVKRDGASALAACQAVLEGE